MESIREKLPMIVVTLIAVTVCIIGAYFIEGYENVYYTQIDNSKVEKISATDNMKYEYTLECYNDKGKKKEIKFKTSRELKEDAYLKLEVRSIGVHAWEEVRV